MDTLHTTPSRMEATLGRAASDMAEIKGAFSCLATKEDLRRLEGSLADGVGAVDIGIARLEAKLSRLPSAAAAATTSAAAILAATVLFAGLIFALKASHLI
jgi:hypothetical protein